jgi:hypothetical protein
VIRRKKSSKKNGCGRRDDGCPEAAAAVDVRGQPRTFGGGFWR